MGEAEQEQQGRGRSAKKRAARAVEELAAALVELSEAELKELPAAAEILGELRLTRQIPVGSARRRQLRHLAGVLRRREEELEELRAFLAGRHQAQLERTRTFHRLEELRDRLCDPESMPSALAEVGRAFPGVDLEQLARLARAVHDRDDRRAFREIFRQLRQARPEPPGP